MDAPQYLKIHDGPRPLDMFARFAVARRKAEEDAGRLREALEASHALTLILRRAWAEETQRREDAEVRLELLRQRVIQLEREVERLKGSGR